MESTTELGWFRAQVVRSILRPREFARSLTREHYSIAGVLVALGVGIALSLTVDLLVLAQKSIDPTSLVSRLIVEAVLLGLRLTIVASIVGTVVFLGVRATRRTEVTIEQAFTAVAFALTPLLLAPFGALLAVLAPGLLAAAAGAVIVIALRALAGLVLNLAAILPLPLAALALALVFLSGSVVMADQVSRVRFTAYAIAPQLASPLAATPAEGKRYDLDGASLVAPAEWQFSVRGIPGEIAHLETATATLGVVRGQSDALATIDSFASVLARPERLGFTARQDERSVVLIDGHVTVDDRADGTYEARHIALRQFAITQESGGLALQFRFFDPPDVDAAFAQAASIAATLKLSGR